MNKENSFPGLNDKNVQAFLANGIKEMSMFLPKEYKLTFMVRSPNKSDEAFFITDEAREDNAKALSAFEALLLIS